jgi:ribosomal protein L27
MQSLAAACGRPTTRLFVSTTRPSLISLTRSSLLFPPQSRPASHATQGTANRAKRGAGKRLGLKKGASEPVVPGNIIFRQRGSLWHAGENCVRGRDHTISALEKGFVRYYRDPARHPTRKYIGVVFDQADKLPRPPGSPRRRRLGLVAVPMEAGRDGNEVRGLERMGDENMEQTEISASLPVVPGKEVDGEGRKLDVVPLLRSYSGRPPNSVLGSRAYARIMEKYKGVRRRQKRLVRLRKRGNQARSTGLSALTARQGAANKKKKRKNMLFSRRKWV